ncbi:HEAT repeat domain-containing protein [Olivibacter sitiensis]|uniref:HEAT repeat domain-containing protein n=1 Tax=Olivibacter sitiensis TaxID=376470 RepID=UPI00040C7945|nr:HEAT repeat domain-containing protein [Olivibacter sitiensis]
MNDPLKKIIKENREVFDHLEAPTGALQQILAKRKQASTEPKRRLLSSGIGKWLIAASVLLALALTYILYDKGVSRGELDNLQNGIAQKETPAITGSPAIESPSAELKEVPQIVHAASKVPVTKKPKKQASPQPTADELEEAGRFAQLTDSSSASIRLAAILDIEKSGRMNDQTLEMLSKTMNEDANSNVRLAAFDLLSQYAYEPSVADVFIKSLATQDDPLVQLSLINLLGNVDNQEVDETLFALANDPETFTAVKDEAYAVLLSQNKL